MPIIPRYIGSKQKIAFQCPIFIDVPTDKGKYQAWEMYDYFIDTDYKENYFRPPSFSWSRQGPNPPFSDRAVCHFTGHRVTSFQDLPSHIQQIITRDYPLFSNPPTGMEEIKELEEELMKSKFAHVK